LGVLPREGYQGTVPKPWAPVEDQSPPRTSGEVPLMERPKPAQNPGAREVAPAPVVPGEPAGSSPAVGKAGERTTLPDAA